MMVTLISQCEKKALKRTRRVLDSFANRIGDNSWQTVITQEGLNAVRKLLKKTASKNTAVSCFWLRSRSRSELIWIVGNRNKFNNQGMVPVNSTEGQTDQFTNKTQWQTINIIQYTAVIAGLFHDFGKTNKLFQDKINPEKKTENFEPYRHEWISLRIFQAFVGDKNDTEWLNALSQIDKNEEPNCFRDGLDGSVADNHPLKDLPPLAKMVAWLILSHHKLPLYPKWKKDLHSPPRFKMIDDWFERELETIWNSYNCEDKSQVSRKEDNWNIEKGLPYQSTHWRSKACFVASQAKVALQTHQNNKTDWLNDQLFTSYIARLCLMLADHYYSAQEEITEQWRNPSYSVWANTCANKLAFKQQLDEHLIGVAHHTEKISQALPRLNSSLNSLEENIILESKVKKEYERYFGWQNKAIKTAKKWSEFTVKHGFLGINMASTGRGKTLANAKIMYSIGAETGRIRFSVALGLRTLTLQTGKEYRDKIDLNDRELAIVVGGSAKQLFENEQNKQPGPDELAGTLEQVGSISQEDILDQDLMLDYKGDIVVHELSNWTKQEKNLDKLICTPVLVSTIDYLMPATEGTSGGKQIAPALRLLTADLVLDEPDDFGLKDLPALCRLVHSAGLLGSRVLLSTATMPPALSYALFFAYQNGWKEYAKANIPDWDGKIVCAWFDEFTSQGELYKEFTQFKSAHKRFIETRINLLKTKVKNKRKGIISVIDLLKSGAVIDSMAETIQKHIFELHQNCYQSKNGKNISIGLVRMANINPLVAVAIKLLKKKPVLNTCVHYCIYHSRYPLAIRSHIENKLDKILKRNNEDDIWQHKEINEKFKNTQKQNHIFVVIASPVAEVGRDHDYDWAIVEPSSMRSIIQLAGRVLRHRSHVPKSPNIVLLNKNYKALSGKTSCFIIPGFETIELEKQNSYDLTAILDKSQYEVINAIPRITEPANFNVKTNTWSTLVELEHKAIARQLFNGNKPANVWWNHHPHWCGEVQRQQRFRQSKKDEAYYRWITDELDQPKWRWKNENVKPTKFGELAGIEISDIKIKSETDNSFWFEIDERMVYTQLASDFNIDLENISKKFGEIRLIEYQNNPQEYKYHPNLGLFRDI
jgi:CRISPR-associated endonuclease/helicase Cas3